MKTQQKKLFILKSERKKDLKKITRASVTYETLPSSLTYM